MQSTNGIDEVFHVGRWSWAACVGAAGPEAAMGMLVWFGCVSGPEAETQQWPDVSDEGQNLRVLGA